MSTMLLPSASWLKKRKKSSKEEEDEKEENKMVSMSDFNEDIVFNIFTRIPGDILQKKFKYQCRKWFELVCHPFFVETHLHQSEDGVLLKVETKMDHPSGLKDHHQLLFMDLKGLEANTVSEIKLFSRQFDVHSVCNGLVLLEVPHSEKLYVTNYMTTEKLYVTNPMTEETISLPSCKHKSKCVTFRNCRWDLVFVPSSKTYKLVELLYDGELKTYAFHVQTLCASSSESWRPIKVSLEFPLPEYYQFPYFVKMGGLLTLIGTRQWPCVDYDVWILKDLEWVKKLSFCVPQDMKKANPYDSKVLGSLNNGEVILLEDGYQGRRILIFYVKTKEWKAVEIFESSTGKARFLRGTHINSIVSIKGFK